jgi:hypothetical protein
MTATRLRRCRTSTPSCLSRLETSRRARLTRHTHTQTDRQADTQTDRHAYAFLAHDQSITHARTQPLHLFSTAPPHHSPPEGSLSPSLLSFPSLVSRTTFPPVASGLSIVSPLNLNGAGPISPTPRHRLHSRSNPPDSRPSHHEAMEQDRLETQKSEAS